MKIWFVFLRERESVNKSQLDIERKTCDIRNRKRIIYFSTYPPVTLLHLFHRFTSTSKPAAQKFLTVVSATSTLPFQLLRHQRNILTPSCEPLYATDTFHFNRKHFFMNILCIESFCLQKRTKNGFFGGTLLTHGHYFDHWNQHLNMRMRVCYLDCHEAGLCCYLVIHIENILLPLQLFYLHLWPVYWLSLIIIIRKRSSIT
jgi:hypothetical protein